MHCAVILPVFKSAPQIAPWYTNPQTEAFCAMLEIENKINPPPLTSKPGGGPAAVSDAAGGDAVPLVVG